MRTAFIKGRLQEATFPRGPRSRVLLSSSSSLLLMLLLFSLLLQATTPFTTAPACSGPGGTLPRLLRLKRSPFCTSPLFLSLSLCPRFHLFAILLRSQHLGILNAAKEIPSSTITGPRGCLEKMFSIRSFDFLC